MRQLQRTSSFKSDFKRIKTDKSLVQEMKDIISLLHSDIELDGKFKDHQLVNSDQRECHIRPDFLLVYKKIDTEDGRQFLILIRCGNHSQIFG